MSRKGYWMWRLEKLKSWNEPRPYKVAQIYAQPGDKEQAFARLEIACEKNDSGLYRLKVEPLLDPLHGDPRFGELLRLQYFVLEEYLTLYVFHCSVLAIGWPIQRDRKNPSGNLIGLEIVNYLSRWIILYDQRQILTIRRGVQIVILQLQPAQIR